MKLDDLPPLNEAGGRSCPICQSVPSVAMSTPVCHGCIRELLSGRRETDSAARVFVDQFRNGVQDDPVFERQKELLMRQVMLANDAGGEDSEQEQLNSF